LFPLGSAYQGIVDLIERVQSGVPVASHDIPPVNGSWLPVLLAIIRQLPVLAVAALVCYLLSRSGEGLRAINLGRTRIRTDLALLLAVFVVVQWIPQWFGAHLLAWTHTQGFFLLPSPVPLSRSALTVAQVAFSLTAGIVEEVVVLGYLVRRLEQRGFNVIAVVAIDVAVRISYHLYYGWNVIPIALWALVSVLIYLRVRRLLPFILCHVAWDAAIPFRAFYPGTYTTMWLVALTITLVLMLAWGTWSPDTSEERFPRVT
jgi:membrane protease YdiL (CAAX protease family)